jgi:hypothetical protein
MKKNVGGYDRIARLVIGPVLLLAAGGIYFEYLAVAGLLGASLIVASLVVGAVLLVTGATQVCPLNSLLGFDTYRGKSIGESTLEDDAAPESEIGRPN